MSFDQYTNDKQTGIEFRSRIGKRINPRSIHCQDAPRPFVPDTVGKGELTPESYLDILNKVKWLKDRPEARDRYNDIVKAGREAIHELELEMASDDKEKNHINFNWFMEERYPMARAMSGKWVDPPDLEGPYEFGLRQSDLGARAQAGQMQLEQKQRKIWLKVYEKLAALYDEMTQIINAADTAKIRRLLNQAFDDPGLDAFCQDYFYDVYNRFSRGMRKDHPTAGPLPPHIKP